MRGCKINYTDMTIELPTGAVMRFESAEKPDNLYGEDVWAAVMDEASRMRQEAWYAIRSTVTATRGPVRIIGNVKGRKNWFYIMCRKAQAGEPNMAYFKIFALDAVAAGVFAAIGHALRRLECVPPEIYRSRRTTFAVPKFL